MKCECCAEIMPIDRFQCCQQYVSVKKSLERMAREGLFERTEPNPFEVYFTCKRCNTVWALAEPDFPVRGYFLQKRP